MSIFKYRGRALASAGGFVVSALITAELLRQAKYKCIDRGNAEGGWEHLACLHSSPLDLAEVLKFGDYLLILAVGLAVAALIWSAMTWRISHR